MTSTPETPRPPRAFSLDDPALKDAPETEGASEAARETLRTARQRKSSAAPEPADPRPTAIDLSRGIRWGGILLSGLAGLLALSAAIWFVDYVELALSRQDWIGWVALALLTIVGVSALVLILRELIGLMRLARLGRLQRDVAEALKENDLDKERRTVHHLTSILAGRADLQWPLARFAGHESDVLKPGDLLSLADRELIQPLDGEARRTVLKASKRVAVVTALSPMAWIAMIYVLYENLRMLRALAGLYGGRPGPLGALRLARMVIGHIIATGGIALTDDLLGQFLGQDLLRRLSRRLGEGAFNGALTARVGAAGVEVCRPLPFISAPPIRARDMLAEAFRRNTMTTSAK